VLPPCGKAVAYYVAGEPRGGKGSWTSAIINRCDTEWMRSKNG
jgi:hypothetical protein